MNHSKTRWLLGFGSLLVLVGGGAAGSEGPECSAIEDAARRLECFDRQYPREPAVREAEVAEEPPVPAPPVALETIPVTEEATASEPTAAVEAAAVAPARETRTFLGDPKVDLTSTIKAIRSGEKQKMVFLLENEEIWMQSSPRPLPFEKGDTVTIQNAFLGGYFMRTDRGVGTRVTRIK